VPTNNKARASFSFVLSNNRSLKKRTVIRGCCT